MLTVLITAYAMNPYKGSEDGMGWNFVSQIARYCRVIAVTRENNRPAVEQYLRENPLPWQQNLHFVYYDLPYYLRFWKKGGRGALLYFYMWQMGMPAFVKKQQLSFDLVHNLNFHNDWTPSWLWKLKKPFVWGPVGHHNAIPKEYIANIYGNKAYFKDRLRWTAKQLFWLLDPFLRISANRAAHVFCMNSHVYECLRIDRHKTSILPSVGSEKVQALPKHNRPFHLLSVGRFVPLKGFDVTIRAFASFYGRLSPQEQAQTSLTLIGKGPEEPRLRQMAQESAAGQAIRFVQWMPREEVMQLYNRSSVFLFPSHEGAGMVVSEALSFGLPVLCFDNYGPGEFVNERCGIKIPYGNYRQSIEAFADALLLLFGDRERYQQLSKGALKEFEQRFDWDRKGETIWEVYKKL